MTTEKKDDRESPGQADAEIEVTPEMVDAGKEVLWRWCGEIGADDRNLMRAAQEVFPVMLRVWLQSLSARPFDLKRPPAQ